MLFKRLIFIIGSLYIAFNLFAIDTIIYPKSDSTDKRFLDLIEILETSLEKTKDEYGEYILKPASHKMQELRQIQAVKKGQFLNITWRTADKEVEKNLLPIYIPLRKGILGYRLFLIKKEDQKKFDEVETIDDLKKYTVGQGGDWADVEVFEHNGFDVIKGRTYEGLFQMLSAGRFDFFSRGVNEIFTEYEINKASIKDLYIEDSILLYYPWPYMFFVSPKYPELAERIEKGLNIMIDDGTMNKIFYKYNYESIMKAKLKKRKLLKIENPYLSEYIPIDNKKLWYQIEDIFSIDGH